MTESGPRVAQDHVVTIHYTLRDSDGNERDTSRGGAPLPYLHGHGNIVPGLETALTGLGRGDQLHGHEIPPELGYGLHDDDLDLVLPLAAFPQQAQDGLVDGVQFVAEHPHDEGRQVLYTVVGREEDTVLVTGNHTLAGEVLVFDVEIVEVRPATAEELEHGHVHGPGGHH